MTRHIALKSGCRTETPGLTVNRLCGSGFQAAIEGAKDIILGECNIVLAGGTENMSQASIGTYIFRSIAHFVFLAVYIYICIGGSFGVWFPILAAL